jgi:hypothetical protein
MLGLINAIVSSTGAVAAYVKEGLVMANKFLTPPKITHPAQGSAEFDGASDYIELPTDVLTDFSAFTISAWFYIDDLESGSVVSFGYTADDNKLLNFEIVSSNTLKFVYRPTGSYTLSSPSNLNGFVGKWNHYVVSVDGANQSIYYNGSEVASTTSGATDAPPSFDKFQIGVLGRSTNNGFFDGNLANVAIWNRALSSDEINSVMWKSYDALTPRETSGLQAWYRLDDVASPTASIASMEQLAADKDATIENKAAITAAINALS